MAYGTTTFVSYECIKECGSRVQIQIFCVNRDDFSADFNMGNITEYGSNKSIQRYFRANIYVFFIHLIIWHDQHHPIHFLFIISLLEPYENHYVQRNV